MKVSYLHSICVKNDAISNAILNEIQWLRHDQTFDTRLFAYACDHDIDFIKVTDPREVAIHSHFLASDLVVFHFGVYYPLFNLLPIVRKTAKRLVVFHNVTPKEYVPRDQHPIIERSMAQMANMLWSDHVICDSETNLYTLRAAGLRTPATILPLAINSSTFPPNRKPSFSDKTVRIVFIGRFVQSKGPCDLLRALQTFLKQKPHQAVIVNMVGNFGFSDSRVVLETEQLANQLSSQFGAQVRIKLHDNASERIKNALLQEADLFILPSYHEGFCVPIIEAFANGCRVLSYTNSNIPSISGNLAHLVPTGDITGLAAAISRAVSQIVSPQWLDAGKDSYSAYAQAAASHAQCFSPHRVSKRFTNLVRKLISNDCAQSDGNPVDA